MSRLVAGAPPKVVFLHHHGVVALSLMTPTRIDRTELPLLLRSFTRSRPREEFTGELRACLAPAEPRWHPHLSRHLRESPGPPRAYPSHLLLQHRKLLQSQLYRAAASLDLRWLCATFVGAHEGQPLKQGQQQRRGYGWGMNSGTAAAGSNLLPWPPRRPLPVYLAAAAPLRRVTSQAPPLG